MRFGARSVMGAAGYQKVARVLPAGPGLSSARHRSDDGGSARVRVQALAPSSAFGRGEGDMRWYLEVLRNYADFSGRSRRKELWMFWLVNLVICMALGFIEGIIGIFRGQSVSVLATLYSMFVLIPGLAVGARRLHDIGRSGWWLVLGLIPILGAIVLLIFFVQDSQAGENRFGPDPKAA